jgi:hypothetical protein
MSCGATSSILTPWVLMNVNYAPPGCTPSGSATGYQCKPASYITYSGSSAGSIQLSLQKSISKGIAVTATLNGTAVGSRVGRSALHGQSAKVCSIEL